MGYTRKDWLEQDVIYIITAGEREAFLKLGTNEERDQFSWRNRNPDPDSRENSFKEEHYRRIAMPTSISLPALRAGGPIVAIFTSCGDRRMS